MKTPLAFVLAFLALCALPLGAQTTCPIPSGAVTLPLSCPSGPYINPGAPVVLERAPVTTPILSSLSPGQVTVSGSGTPVWITITGSNFTDGMTAIYGPYNYLAPVTVIDATRVTFPSTRHSSIGTYPVKIRSVAGDSNTLTFTVVTSSGGGGVPPTEVPEPPQPGTFYGGYRTIDQLYTEINTVATTYPQWVTVSTYGDSYAKSVGGVTTPGGDTTAGYPLRVVRITNNPSVAKPVMLVTAGIHGRELPTYEWARRFIDHLVSPAGAPLRDTRDIYIVPAASPDVLWIVALGVSPKYSAVTGGFPFAQRKNLRGMIPSLWPPLRRQQAGVDLNRNFPTGWAASDPDISSDPANIYYRGPGPLSEPESKGLADLTATIRPSFVKNLHSYTPMVAGSTAALATALGTRVTYPSKASSFEPGSMERWLVSNSVPVALTETMGPWGSIEERQFWQPYSATVAHWPKILNLLTCAAMVTAAPATPQC